MRTVYLIWCSDASVRWCDRQRSIVFAQVRLTGSAYKPISWRVDKRRGAERLSRTPQRPSIIRPAPGRYVNVGSEEGFRSSSCLARLTSCSFGRSTSCALQPMSAVKSKTAITDLIRIILSSHFGDYGSPNIVSQKRKG